MKKFNSILEQYGIFGYQSIAKQILASLAAKEPILLVGEQGTGKTLLAEKLSIALGYDAYSQEKEFIAYDASKSMFEDVIGFPNPNTMQNGKLEYIQTPMTIWDKRFILVDEISRANPSMQNKWLEIIRSRRVMGKEIPYLEYIFAAMNPLGYLGVNPLDSALADRFFMIVQVPTNFDREDLSKIMNFETGTRETKSTELIDLIATISKISENMKNEYSGLIENFIIDFSSKVEQLGLLFSPRRAAMLKKCLSLFFAIDFYDGKMTEKKIVDNLITGVKNSWNYFVTDDEPQLDILKEAFLFATKKITANTKQTKEYFKQYKKSNENGFKSTNSRNIPKQNINLNNTDDDESDIAAMFKIAGAGLELFTVGFYEMVIKGNANWKSKLDINN